MTMYRRSIAVFVFCGIQSLVAWSPDVSTVPPRSIDSLDASPSDSELPAASSLLLKNDNHYKRTRRRVSIRSVDWCGYKGMVPLQHYRGGSIEKSTRKRNGSELDLTNNLSKSSQILSNNMDSLSNEERRRFHSKVKAEARASQPLDPTRDLHILYCDSDIVVVHKPSGVLCVPGPRRNPSLANLVHDSLHTEIDVDKTVVHRLDMDTSGIVVFAASEQALSTLHDDFRHGRVKKTYQALVCGHVSASEMEMDLSLERDPQHPPFMRVAQPQDLTKINATVPAVSKFLNQAPKPSLTELRVLSWEWLMRSKEDNELLPVTRLELRPRTGRTHQLRVHCAAIGHPILGDDIYGYNGEGAPNGGLQHVPHDSGAFDDLQLKLYQLDRPLCLHAKKLCINHPRTKAPMIFEADPSF